MRNNQPVTGIERQYANDIAIISHTNEKGQITFCNDDFVDVSGYSSEELIGPPRTTPKSRRIRRMRHARSACWPTS